MESIVEDNREPEKPIDREKVRRNREVTNESSVLFPWVSVTVRWRFGFV